MSSGSIHSASRIQAFFAGIAHRYDLANHLLSGGLDFLWRRRAAAMVAGWKPERILDLATGSGDLARDLGRACPDCFIIGADFCRPMLRRAQQKGVANLVTADALKLPFAPGTFDAATVAFGLRNMESWDAALTEIRRVLRPGGRFLVLDFSVPRAPFRWIYRPYLHWLLPTMAAIITGTKTAYEYLGESIERFPAGAEMQALLEKAGLGSVLCEPLLFGVVTLYTAIAPPSD
jgi:demethylmenaquinone methyltransferase/2-methoxy-6-polyprenyl-1,4-benzoquinol methylase